MHCWQGSSQSDSLALHHEDRSMICTQAPPSLDEDNFPSLATSPAPSVNGSAATAASAASPAANGTATAVAASPDSSPSGSPRQAKETESTSGTGAARNGPALPAAWGTSSGYAHKAAASSKSSSGDAVWTKAASSAPQQKQQHTQTGSKLQPDAANFKPKCKGAAAAIPWVETGQSGHALQRVSRHGIIGLPRNG